MRVTLSIFAVISSVAMTAPSSAAVVIDQSQSINQGPFSFLPDAAPITSQSFKAGFANSVGGGIFLNPNPSYAQAGFITFSLFNGIPGSGGQVLASASVAALGGTWADAFWSQVPLVVGQTYWLAARSDTAMGSTLGYPNPYASGSAFYGSQPYESYDLTFRTFADDATAAVTTPVPEPATWAMMLLGFGAVGYAMRRKAKVNTRIRFA